MRTKRPPRKSTPPKRTVDKDGSSVGKERTAWRNWRHSEKRWPALMKRNPGLLKAAAFPSMVVDFWEEPSRVEARATRIMEAKAEPGDSARRWHAEEILRAAGVLRTVVRKAVGPDGRLPQGELGIICGVRDYLLKTAAQAETVEYFARVAPAGPKARRNRHPGLMTILVRRVRRDPSLSARALFALFPDGTEEELLVGKSKFYRLGDALSVMEKRGRAWEQADAISFRTFRDYVADAKIIATR